MKHSIIDQLIMDSFKEAGNVSTKIDAQVRGLGTKHPDAIIKSCNKLLNSMYQAKALLRVYDIEMASETQMVANKE